MPIMEAVIVVVILIIDNVAASKGTSRPKNAVKEELLDEPFSRTPNGSVKMHAGSAADPVASSWTPESEPAAGLVADDDLAAARKSGDEWRERTRVAERALEHARERIKRRDDTIACLGAAARRASSRWPRRRRRRSWLRKMSNPAY